MSTTPTFAKPRRPFGDPVAAPSPHAAFLPPPNTNLQNLNLPLRAVLPGVDAAAKRDGRIVFHAVGDTGGILGTVAQDAVAAQMEQQIQKAPTKARPRFFFHLGDVVYYNGQSQNYSTSSTSPTSTMTRRFSPCPATTTATRTRARAICPTPSRRCTDSWRTLLPARPEPGPVPQDNDPAVRLLDAGGAVRDHRGTDSNVDGLLDGHGAYEQQRWLEQQLAAAAHDKFLLIAVHHPPYSLDDNHGGSPAIGDAIDQAAAVLKAVA